jgi:hypothetical protein
MQHVQYPPVYFCNIYKKQLQHTFETIKTPETYICNIGERNGLIDFSQRGRSRRRAAALEHHQHPRARGCPWLGRGRPEASRHMRLSAHRPMAGSTAYELTMGDGRTDGEGASSTGVWDGHAAQPVMGAQRNSRRARGEGRAADNERPLRFWARRISTKQWRWSGRISTRE